VWSVEIKAMPIIIDVIEAYPNDFKRIQMVSLTPEWDNKIL
jgi:hypothetical protein